MFKPKNNTLLMSNGKNNDGTTPLTNPINIRKTIGLVNFFSATFTS